MDSIELHDGGVGVQVSQTRVAFRFLIYIKECSSELSLKFLEDVD